MTDLTHQLWPHQYEVKKPIDGVRCRPAEPWFNQPGNGIEYHLPRSVQSHLDAGELVEIPNRCRPLLK